MREELQASTELRVSNAFTLLCVSHIAIYFVHKGTVHAKAKKKMHAIYGWPELKLYIMP